MALPCYDPGVTTFPTPWRTPEVCYPPPYRRCEPKRPPVLLPIGPTDDDWRGYQGQFALTDAKTECSGDLGWSFEYATAWCYRHLVGNQPLVADTIDTVREFDVEWSTPYQIFEHLDAALFGSKLRGMVYLMWKDHWNCSPGTTSAPGVLGIPRIVIQLNSASLLGDDHDDDDDDDVEIDDLLDALIHHMIHAYFLVCCGAQKTGAKQDGRLMDGLHFGVILMTLRDISKQCDEGVLPMTFHAAKRKEIENGNYAKGLMAYKAPIYPAANNSAMSFISIDPRGCGVGPALADGQTHCMHDNRMISYQAIKNWQVNDYSRALDKDMESKGAQVYEYEPDGKLTPILRVKGPPSITYVELVWDKKHVMVPREKALKFDSIEWPVKKHGRYELEIPKCDGDIFTCIYDFINKGSYPGCPDEIVWDPTHLRMDIIDLGRRAGPPIIRSPMTRHTLDHGSTIKHVKVFKIAEKLKFKELMTFSIARLWDRPFTTDDPIETLRWLYDDHGDKKAGPIHSELHKWARGFLSKTDKAAQRMLASSAAALIFGTPHGLSNLEKIRHSFPTEFKGLHQRSLAFQDDVKLATAELIMTRNILGRSGGLLGQRRRLAALPGLAGGIVGAGRLAIGGAGMGELGGAAALWQDWGDADDSDVEEVLHVPPMGGIANWI